MKFTIANPIFGYVVESFSEQKKKRIFSSDLDSIIKNNTKNSDDNFSHNPLVQLIIYLFPSSKDDLSYNYVPGRSFNYHLMWNSPTGSTFLADLLLKLVNREHEVPAYKELGIIPSVLNKNQDNLITDVVLSRL